MQALIPSARRALALASALSALTCCATSASAGVVLAGNSFTGNQTGNCGFACRGDTAFGAENFTLASASRVESLAVYLISSSASFSPTVDWQVRAGGGDTPGALISSGTTAGTYTVIGQWTAIPWPVYNIYYGTVDIPDLSLASGDYWVAFNVNDSSAYWADTTQGDTKTAITMDSGTTWSTGYSGTGSVANYAFAVIGTTNTVPEPASVLLVALALGAATVARSRRSA